MKKSLISLVCFSTIALFFSGTNLQATDTDLSWVADLVGYTDGVQSKTSEGIKITYHVASAKRAIGLLKKGLAERNWTVKQPRNVSAWVKNVDIFVGTFTATKGEALLKVSTHGTDDSQTLVMILTGGTTPPPGSEDKPAVKKKPSGKSSTEAALPKPAAKKPPLSNETIMIEDDEINKMINCNGHSLKIVSNECDICIRGYCRLIYISGNKNVVKVEGRVDKIDTPGNKNTVTWPASQDPQPKISNWGNKNKLKAKEK